MLKISDWPVETIGVSGIYAFTVIMAGVLLLQIHDIFSRRSAKSLSTTWIIYFCAMFFSGLIYSVTYNRQPILINNLMLTSLHLVIAYGVWRYRGFSRNDWWLATGLGAALVLMLLSPRQDIWFFAFAPGGVVALLKQAYQLYKERSPGVLNPWLLVAGIVSNCFWTAYAFAVHDWTLSIICPANLAAWIIVLSVWLICRRAVNAVEPATAARLVIEP